MTIEDKAERYDELLKKLQKAKEDNDVCDERYCCVIDDIVPELKDSEDERIRKKLIEAVKGDMVVGGTKDKQLAIAWLEKKGESKPIGKLQLSEELYEHIRNTCDCIDNAYSTATLSDMIDYLSTAQRSAKSAFDMIEKQGEKNPYKEDFGDLLMDVKFGIVPSQKQDEQILANSAKTCKDEQKSWSEVDNFMYNKIKNLLTDISLAPEAINSLFDWLKDLKDRVQPQTTWKPSEEQIDALHDAAVYVDKSMLPYPKGILMKLYKQLKKLREE